MSTKTKGNVESDANMETETASSSDANAATAPSTPGAVTAAAPSPKGSAPQRPRTKGEEAYLRIAHLADAYTEAQLLRVTTDLEATSTTAIGAVPKIRGAQPDVINKLPQHDMKYFHLFEDIAWALSHVSAQVNATEEENRALTTQADSIKAQIDRYKDFLVTHASAAGVNRAALRKIGAEFGYKALLSDAGTIMQLLIQNWDELAHKLPDDLPAPTQFDEEVAAFRTALGLKEQNPEGPRLELVRRRRVNTLFRHAVANIREALIYTYGEHKVGEYIPGFSNSSTKSTSRNSKEKDDDSSEVDAGATPSGPPVRPSGFVLNNPAGLPITDPFISDDDADDKQKSA